MQDRELADEAVEQRESHRREEHDHGDRRVNGHHVRDAAVFGDLARVAALVEDADDQEQRAGGDAVIDLLEDRAAEAERRQHENSQRAEAQVAD